MPQTTYEQTSLRVLAKTFVSSTTSTVLLSPSLQFSQCQVQASPLEVYFGWRPEPQHVLLAHGHCLDVDKVLGSNISRHTGAAPAATAKSQGRVKVEVVQVTNSSAGRPPACSSSDTDPHETGESCFLYWHSLAKLNLLCMLQLVYGSGIELQASDRAQCTVAVHSPLACWRVDEDPYCLHGCLEIINMLGVCCTRVKTAGVAMTTKQHQLPSLVQCFRPILGTIQTCRWGTYSKQEVREAGPHSKNSRRKLTRGLQRQEMLQSG